MIPSSVKKLDKSLLQKSFAWSIQNLLMLALNLINDSQSDFSIQGRNQILKMMNQNFERI